MKSRQKAMIVRAHAARTQGLDELNIALSRGWRVVHVAPMGGAAVGTAQDAPELCHAALVVIERVDDAAVEGLEEVEEEVREVVDDLVEGDGSGLDVDDL